MIYLILNHKNYLFFCFEKLWDLIKLRYMYSSLNSHSHVFKLLVLPNGYSASCYSDATIKVIFISV